MRTSPWAAWKPATCLPDACFCEAIRGGPVAQPANTWSSLSFVLLGIAVIVLSLMTSHKYFRRSHGIVFGLALIAIGLGSVFYHATLTFSGQVCDVQGMYLFATFIAIYGLSNNTAFSDRLFVMLYLLVNVIFLFIQIELPGLRRYLFAALLVTVIIIESRNRNHSRYFYGAMATMAIAFAIWTLDITHVVCDPVSPIQGHAIWHIMGAMAALLLYLHYLKAVPQAEKRV